MLFCFKTPSLWIHIWWLYKIKKSQALVTEITLDKINIKTGIIINRLYLLIQWFWQQPHRQDVWGSNLSVNQVHYIYVCVCDFFGAMVFFVGNGPIKPSSNPGLVCLHFSLRKYPWKRYESNNSPSNNE